MNDNKITIEIDGITASRIIEALATEATEAKFDLNVLRKRVSEVSAQLSDYHKLVEQNNEYKELIDELKAKLDEAEEF